MRSAAASELSLQSPPVRRAPSGWLVVTSTYLHIPRCSFCRYLALIYQDQLVSTCVVMFQLCVCKL